MKSFILSTLFIGISLLSCNQSNSKIIETKNQANSNQILDIQKEKTEIQNLIRKVLIWSVSDESIDLFPVLSDGNDSLYIGFDMDKLNENRNILIL